MAFLAAVCPFPTQKVRAPVEVNCFDAPVFADVLAPQMTCGCCARRQYAVVDRKDKKRESAQRTSVIPGGCFSCASPMRHVNTIGIPTTNAGACTTSATSKLLSPYVRMSCPSSSSDDKSSTSMALAEDAPLAAAALPSWRLPSSRLVGLVLCVAAGGGRRRPVTPLCDELAPVLIALAMLATTVCSNAQPCVR